MLGAGPDLDGYTDLVTDIDAMGYLNTTLRPEGGVDESFVQLDFIQGTQTWTGIIAGLIIAPVVAEVTFGTAAGEETLILAEKRIRAIVEEHSMPVVLLFEASNGNEVRFAKEVLTPNGYSLETFNRNPHFYKAFIPEQ